MSTERPENVEEKSVQLEGFDSYRVVDLQRRITDLMKEMANSLFHLACEVERLTAVIESNTTVLPEAGDPGVRSAQVGHVSAASPLNDRETP